MNDRQELEGRASETNALAFCLSKRIHKLDGVGYG